MFAQRFVATLKRDKRSRPKTVDEISEQVKKVLATSDQKLILMVRS